MRKLLLLGIVLLSLSSCRILRPNLMLKTPKEYTFDQLNDSMSHEEYRLSVTDAVSIRVLSNEGFKLVDFSNGGGSLGSSLQVIETIVEQDGSIKLPLLGRVTVIGLTPRETEKLLESKYAEFYVGPYVIVRVNNKRVSVYPGNGGLAKVIPILNANTTVIEALAYAGGITDDGKAYKIKLVRQAKPSPKVYLIDLSTIAGLQAGNTVVQANDIIYVEPRLRAASRTFNELSPYLSVLSTVILLYTYFQIIKQH